MKIRWGVVAILGAVGVVACEEDKPPVTPTAPTAPTPPVATPPTASATPAPTASASTKVDSSDWKGKDRPKDWKDPRAIAALAADCDFVPPKVRDGGMFVPTDVMTCTPEWHQSCMPDACESTIDDCKKTCTTGCTDCGSKCSTSCKSCKDGCKDDACKSKCAETCATCKEDCGRTFDRCTSGTCSKAATDCRDKNEKAWKDGNCQPKCETFTKCFSKCNADAKCTSECEKGLGSVCTKNLCWTHGG